jgi:hypothetical protein
MGARLDPLLSADLVSRHHALLAQHEHCMDNFILIMNMVMLVSILAL